MRVGLYFILAAAVVAVAMFSPSDAGAWGYTRHGHGYYFGIGRHNGFGHHYIYRRHWAYPRHYGFGRHHYGYGRGYYRGRGYYGGPGYYSGRGYASPPAYSQPARPAPAAPTAERSSGCREITTTVVIGDKEQTVSGAACRQNDGSWKLVN